MRAQGCRWCRRRSAVVTVNEVPSSDSSDGIAQAEPAPRGDSWMLEADQRASEIVPVCDPAVADSDVKVVAPKLASGRARQRRTHRDGASAIHSAEERSGCARGGEEL
jgi:hypothetical protein